MTINIQCGCCLLSPHFLGIAISAGKNRTVCIPFSPNAGNKPPSWQHLRLMYAFQDSDGKILASCVHFQVQSGDSECVARKSCRQGPLFASRCPKSCMAHDSCHGGLSRPEIRARHAPPRSQSSAWRNAGWHRAHSWITGFLDSLLVSMGFGLLRDCPNGLFEIAVVDAGGTSFLLRLAAEETEALRGQCRVLCSVFS